MISKPFVKSAKDYMDIHFKNPQGQDHREIKPSSIFRGWNGYYPLCLDFKKNGKREPYSLTRIFICDEEENGYESDFLNLEFASNSTSIMDFKTCSIHIQSFLKFLALIFS